MLNRHLTTSTLFLVLAASACEGEGHDLGTEDGGLPGDTGNNADARAKDGADVQNPNNRCAPVGDLSCMNGNEIVRCQGDHYETVDTCANRCLFLSDQGFACEGGARSFTPTNVGLIVDGAVLASISTVNGAIGCGLANDYELSPGLAGEQVYLVLANVGFECPDGVYGLNAGCNPEYPLESDARCAIYRRWTESRLEAVEALSGAVTISSAQTGVCNYQVDLVLGGVQQSVRFAADLGNNTGTPICVNPM